MSDKQNTDAELPHFWRQIHAAIWLIGLALLFWYGDIFPGILVLVAISGVAQAAMAAYVKKQQAGQELQEVRERHLPSQCPNCGSPINAQNVRWVSERIAACPYCGTQVKATEAPSTVA